MQRKIKGEFSNPCKCAYSRRADRLESGSGPKSFIMSASPPAGRPTSPPYWCSVSSWCASGTEGRPLIGSPTSTRCPPPTPAPPVSQIKSWRFCRPACGDGLWSNGRRCEKSTPPIKTSSGESGAQDAERVIQVVYVLRNVKPRPLHIVQQRAGRNMQRSIFFLFIFIISALSD